MHSYTHDHIHNVDGGLLLLKEAQIKFVMCRCASEKKQIVCEIIDVLSKQILAYDDIDPDVFRSCSKALDIWKKVYVKINE